MVRFLSPEWIVALDDAAQAFSTDARFVFQQVVTGCPDGEDQVRYFLCFGDGRLSVQHGQALDPDLTVTATYPVAVALARGEVNAQQAITAGELRLSGNLKVLAAQSRPLAQLADVFAAVREDTSY
jgi:putative sterol carrier protein